MTTIREAAQEGKSQRAISRETGYARNTVRKYLQRKEETPEQLRVRRPSKLDAYKATILSWIEEDHLYCCTTMLARLREQGYTGGKSILKAFVSPYRPPRQGKQPVLRYETEPGKQLQFDWGEFTYEAEGEQHKVYGFTAVLGYSRMRYVCFVKRTDAPTLLRCFLEACEYFGGLPHTVLTDRMKSVLLSMDGREPQWHPLFLDCVTSLGIVPKVCRAYTPQTKGKVERSINVVRLCFWPGVRFTDLDDLNRQARAWCDRLCQRQHRTTHRRPIDMLGEEHLQPLPDRQPWERFGAEERKVSWDGFVSYDGVLYGLPSAARCVGKQVLVREHGGELTFLSRGMVIHTIRKDPVSGQMHEHPEQFTDVAPAAGQQRQQRGIGHLLAAPAPVLVARPLAEYDVLCGVGGESR